MAATIGTFHRPSRSMEGHQVSPQPLTGHPHLHWRGSHERQAGGHLSAPECNFAICPPGIGRFGVNAFIQKGKVGLIPVTIPAHAPHH